MNIKFIMAVAMFLTLSACGSGGGNDNSTSNTDTLNPALQLSGIVNGADEGLLLSNEFETVAINANGSFSFSKSYINGESYNISIAKYPAQQDCSITNQSGIFTNFNIDQVSVICNYTASNVKVERGVLHSNTRLKIIAPAATNVITAADGIDSASVPIDDNTQLIMVTDENENLIYMAISDNQKALTINALTTAKSLIVIFPTIAEYISHYGTSILNELDSLAEVQALAQAIQQLVDSKSVVDWPNAIQFDIKNEFVSAVQATVNYLNRKTSIPKIAKARLNTRSKSKLAIIGNDNLGKPYDGVYVSIEGERNFPVIPKYTLDIKNMNASRYVYVEHSEVASVRKQLAPGEPIIFTDGLISSEITSSTKLNIYGPGRTNGVIPPEAYEPIANTLVFGIALPTVDVLLGIKGIKSQCNNVITAVVQSLAGDPDFKVIISQGDYSAAGMLAVNAIINKSTLATSCLAGNYFISKLVKSIIPIYSQMQLIIDGATLVYNYSLVLSEWTSSQVLTSVSIANKAVVADLTISASTAVGDFKENNCVSSANNVCAGYVKIPNQPLTVNFNLLCEDTNGYFDQCRESVWTFDDLAPSLVAKQPGDPVSYDYNSAGIYKGAVIVRDKDQSDAKLNFIIEIEDDKPKIVVGKKNPNPTNISDLIIPIMQNQNASTFDDCNATRQQEIIYIANDNNGLKPLNILSISVTGGSNQLSYQVSSQEINKGTPSRVTLEYTPDQFPSTEAMTVTIHTNDGYGNEEYVFNVKTEASCSGFWSGTYQLTTNKPSTNFPQACTRLITNSSFRTSGSLRFREGQELDNIRTDYVVGGTLNTPFCDHYTNPIEIVSDNLITVRFRTTAWGGVTSANISFNITNKSENSISGTFNAPSTYGVCSGTWNASRSLMPFPKCIDVSPNEDSFPYGCMRQTWDNNHNISYKSCWKDPRDFARPGDWLGL